MNHLKALTIAGLVFIAGPALAQEHKAQGEHSTTKQHAEMKEHGEHAGMKNAEHMMDGAEHKKEMKRVGDPWPLDTCVVSGEKLGSMGEPIVKLHEGREVRFCCKGCIGMFEKDPAKYLAKADEAIKQQQKARYPLETCIVSGEALSADETKNVYDVVGNRLFVYCCPACAKEVRATPEEYLEKLDKAVVAKQSADYPLDTCVVSGEPLGSMGDPINVVVNGELVKLCCKGCIKKLQMTPGDYMPKLHSAHHAGQSNMMGEKHQGMMEQGHGSHSKDVK